MSDPLVSIVMPAFDGGAYIGEALRSVFDQTFEDYEVVIVDDDSHDDTIEVISAFSDPRLRVLRNDQRLGPVENWNRALEEARGELVKVMAQDDVMYRTCLEQQVSALRAHSGASFVAVRRRII
ncbi:MAG: glycosyltransferase, partial [Acidimicrobiia bacterium]|nr:glycosyltransferase [Acidimicrobiia bacterium]